MHALQGRPRDVQRVRSPLIVTALWNTEPFSSQRKKSGTVQGSLAERDRTKDLGPGDRTVRHKSGVVRTRVGFIYGTNEVEIVQAVGTALPRPPRGTRQCRAHRLNNFAREFFLLARAGSQ